MKIFDVNGKLVTVDMRQSTYPRKGKSASKLQGLVGERLDEIYGNTIVLEEFLIPGSKLRVDFFLPLPWLGIEVSGEGNIHENYTPIFHGPRSTGGFRKQVGRDIQKAKWFETNNIKLITITSEDDLKLLEE